MTIRWPDTLPGVSMPGYGLQPVDPTIRTNMEVGQQKVRRRTSYRLDRVTMQWIFSDAQMEAFRAWYEGMPVSIAGASDDLSAWTLLNATRGVAAAVSPDFVAVDRLPETTATGVHRASISLPGAATNNISLLCRASFKAFGGRLMSRLTLEDRAGVANFVNLDLVAGTLYGASGLTSYSVSDRGDGWWRVTITASTGTGALTPVLRLSVLDDSGTASYAGNAAKGLDLCEMQARIVTGYDLFVPSDASGNALGAGGGAAWFWTYIANGGGATWAEARFTGGYKGSALSGLRWPVTAEVEVRNA